MRSGRIHTRNPGFVAEALERQVLALLTIRPRLPVSALVGLLSHRPVRDVFAVLRRLREQGRVEVAPSRRDCDILRVETVDERGQDQRSCPCGEA